jgi:membrane-bound lytic murein transglycosylase B
MPASIHDRRLAGVSAARRAVPFAMACCLAVSCASGEESQDRQAGQDHAASGAPRSPGEPGEPPSSAFTRSAPDEARDAVPTAPAIRDAIVFARQLDYAAATLRDRRASANDVRKAGEFQQLAVRALADSAGGFRGNVMARLHPETALVTGASVRAAWSLQSMGGPADTMPTEWRIVAPLPPAELLAYYRDAQQRTGVHWTYLAAIHLVETRMGRIRGVSSAGARGPMQFIPTTWDLYGAGGDINDPRDAILAAARLLRANGAPADMANALWHYNPADAYVRAVSEYAHTMRQSRSAYLGYWHWRVFYTHTRATYLLPVGYPETRAVPLELDEHEAGGRG